jgi:hypothetical protein
VEEVNAVLNAILDDDAACVALDEFAGQGQALRIEQKHKLFDDGETLFR